MPILIDSKGTQFTSQDPQQIYNALKSGNYQLNPGSNLYIRDANDEAWQLDSTTGDINQQLITAFESGGRLESKDEAFTRMYPELTGLQGDVLAGVTSAANSALLGLPAVALSGTKTGALFESLRSTHPISSMVGDVAGVISNVTPAGAIANVAGKAAGGAVSGAGRLATMAAEGATIGAVSSIPLAVTEQALGNPASAAENFIGTVGGGALIGGIASPLLGVAVPKAAELFGLTTKASTDLTNRGIGTIASKLDNSMTVEQKALFENLVKDPEARKAALSLTKDVEEITIKSTIDDLTNLSKIIKEDVKGLYDTKFEKIVQDLPKEAVLKAKQEMLDLLNQAKKTMQQNPESFDSSYLKAIKAAEKTLDVRGAVNIKTRETFEEAMKKLGQNSYAEIDRGFDIAKAKAIKEARTEIGYKAGFDSAKVGMDRTGMLARELYENMSSISNRLYGDEFVKISDTYATTKEVLDDIRKLAFNSDGTVNYNKVKAMISSNKANELRLDDLVSKVEELSAISGKEYNFGNTLNDTLKGIRTKQLLRTMGGDNIIKASDIAKIGTAEGIAAAVTGLPPFITTAAMGAYKSLKNPRGALGIMNFLQEAQVRTSNAVNKIANTVSKNKTGITKIYQVGGESFEQTKQDVIKDIKTYQMYTSPQSIDEGYTKTFGILNKIAPNFSANVKAKSMDVANFLAKKAPQYSEDPITGEIKLMSTQQKINEYKVYKAAVNEPLKALEQINSGVNVALNREVLQTIYPYMWNQYVQTKLQAVQGKNLSIGEKRSLNFTLGLENQDFTLPSIINNAINPIEANQAQQPNKPVSSPSANTGETSRIQRP